MNPLRILLIASTLTLSSAFADKPNLDAIDDTIAAGVVFKVSYSLSAEAPAIANPTPQPPESATTAIDTISKDLENLSDSEHGKLLKTKGQKLIHLLRSIAQYAQMSEAERAKLQTEYNLPSAAGTTGIDPHQWAIAINHLITDLAKASHTPEWVYNPQKRQPTQKP